MDTIAFTDEGEEEGGVRITINGRDFIQLVREIEMPFTTAEGHPDHAGDYNYFGPMVTFAPCRHFYGEPVHEWTDGPGRSYVLCCTCGIPACWALSARILVGDQEVIWSDFKQIWRGADSHFGEWRYEGLGPFIFDRQLHDQQLLGWHGHQRGSITSRLRCRSGEFQRQHHPEWRHFGGE